MKNIINSVEKCLFNLVDIYEYEVIDTLHNMIDLTVDEDETFTLSSGIITHNSALGGLIKVRDPKLEGGYALRGKIMNTHGMKDVDIVKNKELSELLTIIGLDLSTEEIDELNYGIINIMSDLDYDGHSIFCLLLQFFSRWPTLFKENRIYRVLSPLYIAKKKNDTKVYYTKDEYDADKDNLKGYEISFNKGLGSLDESEYETMIRNPRTIAVTWENHEKLDMAFGDSAELRKEWMVK